MCRQGRAIVVDAQREDGAVAGGCHLDGPAPGTPGDAVLDGVFHQRLHDEIRHLRLHERVGNVDLDPQPVGKAHLLYGQVFVQEVHLFLHAHAQPLRAVRHAPQQVAQGGDDGDRIGVPLFAYQPGHGVERVEDEMGLQLQPQRGKLCLRQQFGQAGAGRALVQQAVVGVERRAGRGDGGIDQHIAHQIAQDFRAPQQRKRCGPGRIGKRIGRMFEQRGPGGPCRADRDAGRAMHGPWREFPGGQGKTMQQAERHRRQQGPGGPGCGGDNEQGEPGVVHVHGAHRDDGLGAVEQGERQPGGRHMAPRAGCVIGACFHGPHDRGKTSPPAGLCSQSTKPRSQAPRAGGARVGHCRSRHLRVHLSKET